MWRVRRSVLRIAVSLGDSLSVGNVAVREHLGLVGHNGKTKGGEVLVSF